jgi:hypothetical protein
MPRSRWVLSMARHPHLLTRVADDALELEVVGGTMLTGQVERLFRRAEYPFRAGDQVRLDGMTAAVIKVDARGLPMKVRFSFDRSLDDRDLVFLLVTKDGMLRYPMGPVGATMPIPPARVPLVLDIAAQDRAAGR